MKKIKVSLKNRSYDILIGRKLLPLAGKFLSALNTGKKVLVVSNKRVAKANHLLLQVTTALKRSGFEVAHHELSHGNEMDKSEFELSRLWKTMLRLKLDRSSTLLALGGGVVGDIGGFAASAYMRGIHLVQVPTTLLAQVDSSIGGKTAIDLTGGKNLIGAFYQPRLVISDLDTLSTLGAGEFRNSFAEVIKYGVIKDPALFRLLESYGSTFMKHISSGYLDNKDYSFLETVIFRCAKIKAAVVAADEQEKKGLRMILNYGHTFAHALETACRYHLPHGEAVALGIIIAARLAELKKLVGSSFAQRQRNLIQRIGLPVSLKVHVKRFHLSADKITSLMKRDKKATEGTVRVVLPKRLGQVGIYILDRPDWRRLHQVFQELGLK